MEKDHLLDYYKHRLELCEEEYEAAIDSIEQLKVDHEEAHKLHWENVKRAREVQQLQQALGDFQAAVYEERKHTLKIVADNDALKIQELKDRKKIRFLLSLSGAPEEEITYFRDRLDKRLIKIARGALQVNQASSEERSKLEKQDIIIMEDEVEGLKLEVASLQAQLKEQKEIYEQSMDGLIQERLLKQQEILARTEYNEEERDNLLARLTRMRALCRENTRELLRQRKDYHQKERKLIEEKAALVEKAKKFQEELSGERERNENQERIIEAKQTKQNNSVINSQRQTIRKLEHEILNLRDQNEQLKGDSIQKVEYYKSRYLAMESQYTALQKRRDFEIEGFTNDILNLRQQLKSLEKAILKYDTIEDGELRLLNIARVTGETANIISGELQDLKAKIYQNEKQLQSLAY